MTSGSISYNNNKRVSITKKSYYNDICEKKIPANGHLVQPTGLNKYLKEWLLICNGLIWLRKSVQYEFQLNNCRLFKEALNSLTGCSKKTVHQSNGNTQQYGVTPRAVIWTFRNFRLNGHSTKQFVLCARVITRLPPLILQLQIVRGTSGK